MWNKKCDEGSLRFTAVQQKESRIYSTCGPRLRNTEVNLASEEIKQIYEDFLKSSAVTGSC
jgi:hypothetical protein